MRNCQTILQSGWTIFHAHQYCLRTPVFPYLHWHLYCQGFLVFCYSNRCIVVSHLGLICISLVTNSGNFDVCLFTLHMYIYIHIYIFFGEVSIEIFYPFYWVVCVFIIEFWKPCIYHGYTSLIKYMFCKYFLTVWLGSSFS